MKQSREPPIVTGMVEFLNHLQGKDMSIWMQLLSQHVYTTNKYSTGLGFSTPRIYFLTLVLGVGWPWTSQLSSMAEKEQCLWLFSLHMNCEATCINVLSSEILTRCKCKSIITIIPNTVVTSVISKLSFRKQQKRGITFAQSPGPRGLNLCSVF